MLGTTPWPREREGRGGNVRIACDKGEAPEILGDSGFPDRTQHTGDLDSYAKVMCLCFGACFLRFDRWFGARKRTHNKGDLIPQNRHMRTQVDRNCTAISFFRGNQRAHFMLHPPPCHILFFDLLHTSLSGLAWRSRRYAAATPAGTVLATSPKDACKD